MEVPSPISLSVVFKAHCMIRFSQRLVHDGECDLPTQCHALWTRCLWGCFENWVPLSESILFGVPCHHKTYFLRPKIMFLVVAWGKGYVSSHLVVSSIIVSTCCLSGRAWGSVIWPICQISPYLYFSHPHPYQRGFKRLACLIAAYFTFMNSLCNSVNGSVQPVYGPIIMSQLFRDALRCHEPIGLFLPAQIQTSHFSCISLPHLLIWFYIFQWPSSWVWKHLHDAVLQPAAVFCHNSATQVQLCAVSCSVSIAVSTLTGSLPLSMTHYKVLAIFLIQQCLKPAWWLSALQTDSIYLVFQQFLWLVMWNSTQQVSTFDVFLQ